jgi:hypothetical protein
MYRFGVALAVLALLVSQAHAVTKTLTWDPVTTDTSGNPTTIDHYTLYRSVNGGISFSILGTVPGAAVPLEVTDANVPLGNICYQATATNAAGEGAASNRLCFQVSASKPQSPVLRAN